MAFGGIAIDTLTSKQRAHLRSLAHRLKPILQIGGDGVSHDFIGALDEAFNTRELLKVKVLEGAPTDARAAADEISRRLPEVRVPQVIGRTIVLYRPFPETPEIRLPR
jgi:RNA-binding protein